MNEFPEKRLITGLILAGGLSRRMEGVDKGLLQVCGKSMTERVLERLLPQIGSVLISANRNEARYSRLGFPVVKDRDDRFNGPLAGILAALERITTPYLLVTPCDSPFLPEDLSLRLFEALKEAGRTIAVAHDGKRLQPVFSLLDKSVLPDLADYLGSGERKLDRWYQKNNAIEVDFSDCEKSFVNINTPDELAQLKKELER